MKKARTFSPLVILMRVKEARSERNINSVYPISKVVKVLRDKRKEGQVGQKKERHKLFKTDDILTQEE